MLTWLARNVNVIIHLVPTDFAGIGFYDLGFAQETIIKWNPFVYER